MQIKVFFTTLWKSIQLIFLNFFVVIGFIIIWILKFLSTPIPYLLGGFFILWFTLGWLPAFGILLLFIGNNFGVFNNLYEKASKTIFTKTFNSDN